MFTGLEAVLAEVKIVTVPAFESGSIYWEHLTTIAPVDGTRVVLNSVSVSLIK